MSGGVEFRSKKASYWRNSQLAIGLAKARKDLVEASTGKVCWLDPYDKATLFQDAAGTIPVESAGDPVGLILDKSGYGLNAVQTNDLYRPTYGTDGNRGWIEGNGAQFMAVDWKGAMVAAPRVAVVALQVTGGDSRRTIMESYRTGGETGNATTGWQAISLETITSGTQLRSSYFVDAIGNVTLTSPNVVPLGTDFVGGFDIQDINLSLRTNGTIVAAEAAVVSSNNGGAIGFHIFANRQGIAGARMMAGRIYGLALASGGFADPATIYAEMQDRL